MQKILDLLKFMRPQASWEFNDARKQRRIAKYGRGHKLTEPSKGGSPLVCPLVIRGALLACKVDTIILLFMVLMSVERRRWKRWWTQGPPISWAPKPIPEGCEHRARLRQKLRLIAGSAVARKGAKVLLKTDGAAFAMGTIRGSANSEFILGMAPPKEFCLVLNQAAQRLVIIEALLMRPHALGRG